MRLYPYYDQYGRPSGQQTDSHRPAYDSSGRRLAFDGSSSSSQNNQNQISHNYQYYDANQQPPRNHPGYDEWLRNQYRIRGIVPRRYDEENDSGRSRDQQNREFEQPAYVLQPSSGNSDNNRVYYEENKNQLNFGNSDSESSRNSGETYYSVNPGDPVDASASQIKPDGEYKQIRIPGEDSNSESVDRKEPENQHVRLARYHVPTIVRDKKGNLYERRVENGKVFYVDASGNEIRPKIDNSAIDMKIEKILEDRRIQEENLRHLVGNSEDDGSDPVSAAEIGRQG
uniref:Uncharacterized protein n=1 Tax=Caenorhabditis tropicalis TaxID=1561998 RepID=A0A1I7THP2_9PELO